MDKDVPSLRLRQYLEVTQARLSLGLTLTVPPDGKTFLSIWVVHSHPLGLCEDVREPPTPACPLRRSLSICSAFAGLSALHLTVYLPLGRCAQCKSLATLQTLGLASHKNNMINH